MESDHLLTRFRAAFKKKKGVIKPDLKDVPTRVEEMVWTRSINPEVTTCTFGDILLTVSQVLDKYGTNYISIPKCCSLHHFNRELNMRKCPLHKGDWFVAAATYTYVAQSHVATRK